MTQWAQSQYTVSWVCLAYLSYLLPILRRLLGQITGAATIFVWVFVASLIVWSLIKLIIGLRISEEDEYEGADRAECGMEAYPEFVI